MGTYLVESFFFLLCRFICVFLAFDDGAYARSAFTFGAAEHYSARIHQVRGKRHILGHFYFLIAVFQNHKRHARYKVAELF